MNIEQEKMIVEALPSLYPLQKFEEDAVHAVIDALPHWIPVTERLPEYGVDCIVTVKQKYTWQTDWEYFVDLGWRGDYIDGAWDTANDWDEGQETHISAWMPLPEPFKGVTS